ncbi:MAG TPA: FtsQ-type POTRA domain-containing protein [Candidatus Acidoferrum sp.]|jgi:cell division protein FtsQ|nr:FtsQ-type POTRA domain-containing protein [Candidatus Acidoferrum sp.]
MARESKKAPPPSRSRWKLLLGVVVLAAVCATSAMAGYKVRQFVSTDPQFYLSRARKDAITIQGLRNASRWKVQRVFAGDYDRSIYLVPLTERQRRLEAIDWIESATVSRVWPDRIVVRVRERQPIAFVNLNRGVMLIDAHGKLLEPPAKSQFAFPVISGITDNDTDAQTSQHVATFLRVQSDMGYLMKEVSEVDTADPENVRLVAQADSRAVILLVGEGNYAARYQNFLKHYQDIVKRSPKAKVFDLRLDDRITVKD